MIENPRVVLGVSSYFHDSAAALVVDGRLVAAAQEERFTRKKGDASFPDNAIEYCLSQVPRGRAMEALAYYEHPGLKIERIVRSALDNAPKGALNWRRTLKTLRELDQELPRDLLRVFPDPDKVQFVPHHKSHAASAFYPSPFERAAVLVVDGVGEWSTTTLWRGDETGLTALREIRFPHSLGLLYSAFTQYCGFKVNSGEYKLMGLAPFGRARFTQLILDKLIDVKDDGSFALNMEYFGFATRPSTIGPLFEGLFGEPPRPERAPMTPHYMDVAASGQAALQHVMRALATSALAISELDNLCLAGGVAQNCVANSDIARNVAGLKGLWIQPAPGDAGGAAGAAFVVAQKRPRQATPGSARDAMSGALLGPDYTDDAVAEALEAAGVVYERPATPEDLISECVTALQAGEVIGHFHGRMEFGPRALGNRSILADPRPAGTLHRVNLKIKFREGWRPFAPVVLAEEAERLFEPPFDSPHMLLVAQLRQEFRGDNTLRHARASGGYEPAQLQGAVTSDFAAVTHVDYSARLQTIDSTSESRMRSILDAFFQATGCPILLNTSFNVRGEPIVCSPADAVACFLNTDLDVLVAGPFIVQKAKQPGHLKARMGRMHFDPD
ncbi:carbamoyltransferase [Hyphomonas johnsonii]|uniref:NodU family carbamoyl transferase n=1 Tax=Hyphomonas johnsonii MHS-2 TaxID=1280950 RepID=A0A059FTK5_9PROT|nr:carbamoyltransferase N-terminal domain-containing protein [Hyphomonas johnsonii]KCZ94000.1 NodU family carbamoyl transferase [Hyphomonas johnsonii MHS-2]